MSKDIAVMAITTSDGAMPGSRCIDNRKFTSARCSISTAFGWPVEPEVKTVKVRGSMNVMAELEALRKRATQTTPRAPKRDILADLDNLRPKRDLHRTLQLRIPADVLPRTRSVRVTLSFEDGEQGVIDTRDQQVELGDTSDVQSLSVNLKIDVQ